MEQVFSEKKRFHLLKCHVYKNGKAQNMPVVAIRLVSKNIPKYNFQSSISTPYHQYFEPSWWRRLWSFLYLCQLIFSNRNYCLFFSLNAHLFFSFSKTDDSSLRQKLLILEASKNCRLFRAWIIFKFYNAPKVSTF